MTTPTGPPRVPPPEGAPSGPPTPAPIPSEEWVDARELVPRRRWTLLVVALVVIVALVLGGVVWIALSGSDDGSDAWDPGVEPIARAVERLRGLEFKHPVEVRFLSDNEFDEFVASGPAPSADEIATAQAQGEDTIAEYRALGLTDSPAGVLTDVPPLTGIDGLRGLYLAQGERILMRAGDRGALGDALLAHELTHALQDQHYGFERLGERVSTPGEGIGLQALLEGDANDVMGRYVAELADPGQDEFFREEERLVDEIDTAGVPEIFLASGFQPYVLGRWVVAGVRAEGGAGGLDRAYADPPALGVHLVNPVAYLDDVRADRVPEPDLGPGEEAVDLGEGALGAGFVYWILTSRIDPAQALSAADEWGGAARTPFRRGSVFCTRVHIVGGDDEGSAVLADAVRDWAAAMPSGAVTIDQVDEGVGFTACDAQDAAQPPSTPAPDAMSVVAIRNAALARALEDGASKLEAKCAADTIVAAPEFVAEIIESRAGWVNLPRPKILEAAYARMADARAACGANSR